VFEREGSLDAAAVIAAQLTESLGAVRAHPRIRAVRQVGLMCGIEVEGTMLSATDAVSPAWGVANAMYDRGHFTRPIGDVIQLVPPLTSTTGELDRFVDALFEALG